MTGAFQAARRAARAASPATTAVAANAHCGVASNPPSQKIPTPTAATARPVASAFTDPLWRVLRRVVDELEVRHLGGIPLARADLDDARVAARPIGEPGRDVREELVDDVLRAEVGEGLRRACRSPRLPSVIICSAIGRTALAFATVVLIRPCSMSAPARFAYSALRCAESRPSFFPTLVAHVSGHLSTGSCTPRAMQRPGACETGGRGPPSTIPRLPGGSGRAWRASP